MNALFFGMIGVSIFLGICLMLVGFAYWLIIFADTLVKSETTIFAIKRFRRTFLILSPIIWFLLASYGIGKLKGL